MRDFDVIVVGAGHAGLNKRELREQRSFLADLGFHILPLSENIGHRATVYLEEYALKARLGLADALTAATATENKLRLCTGNAKHYRTVSEIELQVFRQ